MKPYRDPSLCPEAANHRTGPVNHVDWHAWAEAMQATHDQQQCPGCDLWVIWTPKDQP